MNIDFAKILQNSQSSDLEPRDIFMSLPGKDKKYEYPRDVQSDVWKKWFECRKNKNNIIKMNTGSGKTTVGLLILKSCLNEGVGPAVYVVPDAYLVEQVCKEAQTLGIKTSTDEKDLSFIRGQSILIINIHKLINGKSVFGMRGVNNVEIGSIIIDDAHACLTTIKDQYTLQIPRETEMYSKILQLFSESLKNQCANKFTELCRTDSRDLFMLVPYWEWQEHQNEVYEIIRENLIDGEPLSFRLQRIKSELKATTPKTAASIRKISICDECLNQLIILRSRQRLNTKLIFPSPITNGYRDPSSITRKLHRMQKRAGVPQIRFHDLRHSFATLSLEQGMDIKTISHMLGHTDAGFTMNTYMHVTDSMQQTVANAMGNLVAEKENEKRAKIIQYTA